MIHLSLTEEEVSELQHERFHHPHPRVQKKMEAVLLRAKGLTQRDVCDILDIWPNTLRSYLRQYNEGGIERLKRFDAGGSRGALDEHVETIRDYFAKYPPHTLADAAEKIEELTGVRRGTTQVAEFLRRNGFRRIKVGSMPAKADPEEQERFKKKSLPLA